MKITPHDPKAYAVMKALRYGTAAEFVDALAEKPNLDWEDSEQLTTLHYAAREGRVEAVRLLLDAGANPLVKDIHNRTPLSFAAERGDLAVAELLIAAGGAKNDDDIALHLACEQRQGEMVKLLLKAHVDVNFLPRAGETALMRAARNDDTGIMRSLLDAGANIAALDMFNNTALHLAAHKDARNAARLLMGLGADVNAMNIYGGIPAYVARDQSHEHMESLIGMADSIRRDFQTAAESEKHLVQRREKLVREEELRVFDNGTPHAVAVRRAPIRFQPKH
ncbi:MAG: ankyrin repeat domain-containing protein [Micavibrio sp.]|nr:ankyrin repeat domain-containing protein [Micavibrio sp.]